MVLKTFHLDGDKYDTGYSPVRMHYMKNSPSFSLIRYFTSHNPNACRESCSYF